MDKLVMGLACARRLRERMPQVDWAMYGEPSGWASWKKGPAMDPVTIRPY